MPLTARQIEQAKPKDKPYKLTDGAGLYLYVAPSGLKAWRKNFTFAGKQKTATLGRWPSVSLADARRRNAEFVASGANKVTFEHAARQWLAVKLPTLTNPKHQAQVQQTLEEFVLPMLGTVPLDRITRRQLVETVQAIDARGTTETAHRVAGRITAVLDFAVDSGWMETHAGAGLTRVLTARTVKRPMPCIAVDEAPALLQDIDNYQEVITRWALQLLSLTFVRTSELRGMRWGELIENGAVWLIPAERMKRRVPHVVPLSAQARAVLDKLRDVRGGAVHDDDLVIPSVRPGKPISENTLLFALYRMGWRGKMTGHGFRALASSVLNEQSPFSADVIERQLAHKETDAVRAAYHRAEYLEQRRDLMQWWANWLDNQRAASQ